MSNVKIGLIPCPGLPEKLAYKLQKQLPNHFRLYISDAVNYTIDIYTDALVGAAEDTTNLMKETAEIKDNKNWDIALALTDLPLFDGKDLVLADADYERAIGQISIPAFGSFPLPFRVRKVVTQVIGELFEHTFEKPQGEETAAAKSDGMSDVKKRRIGKQFASSLIRRYKYNVKGDELDLHLVIKPRLHAKIRVLSGMTFANRPWFILPSFKPVIAVAFATGAYGLIFPTLWTLSASFDIYRFFGLMIAAILSMVIWIILAHQLWEKKTENNNKAIRRLYNRATIITLIIAVVSYYVALFILFLLTTQLFVSPRLLTSLAGVENPQFINYAKLAWLATSIATFAGSIGAGLEKQDRVENIVYSYRQKRRAKNKQPDQDDNQKEKYDLEYL